MSTRVVGVGLEEAGDRGHEADLEQRRADHDRGRHADQVDHRRHHDEPAADAEHGREQPAEGADRRAASAR